MSMYPFEDSPFDPAREISDRTDRHLSAWIGRLEGTFGLSPQHERLLAHARTEWAHGNYEQCERDLQRIEDERKEIQT